MDQDELCELIYTLAGRIVPTESFQLGLFDGDEYQIKVWIKDGARQPPASFHVPEGQGIIGWLRAPHQPLLVRDLQVEMDALPARPAYHQRQPPALRHLPAARSSAIPPSARSRSRAPSRAHSTTTICVCSPILANQSASALNNARLYERGRAPSQRADGRLGSGTSASPTSSSLIPC